MSDEVKHECAVAMVVLRRPLRGRLAADFGGTKLSLLMEKQHNRGQDGAGAAILSADPVPGEEPYWIAKSASATPLSDVLGAIGKRNWKRTSDIGLQTSEVLSQKPEVEKIFLGHLRYATFGKNDVAFCHPFVHEASELEHTLLLAGNFNLTNAHELFEDYRRKGEFPTSRADGYLVCELIAHELGKEGLQASDVRLRNDVEVGSPKSEVKSPPIATALSKALANVDGAWTLCGATGDGWAFATRDPHGIRPGFYHVSDDVVAVASERPAIQAAFDVPPEAVQELPPGKALVVSPAGEVQMTELGSAIKAPPRPCSFERIYFSRANDAAIHRERKALGAALLPQILKSAEADISDIFFSYIPNSARIAFHGLLEELMKGAFHRNGDRTSDLGLQASATEARSQKSDVLPIVPRFGEVIVKDAKFRTFIADAAARREFYKHVYDVTYGLVRPGRDTLVVLDDSIVRGNTMKNAILPMLDRLGPKRIVIASSAPPIRYPDCYGIDMSTLGELVAFRALVNLLGQSAESELRKALGGSQLAATEADAINCVPPVNPLAPLYTRFTDEQHCAEIARLLTPPGMKAEVKVVYQSVEGLRLCLTSDFGHHTSTMEARGPKSEVAIRPIGDWYFTGDYPTPGGYKVLHRALRNYLEHKSERPY
ncbi:MAG: amidophosphoribosyltransferase [Kiritimatiellae bacterium]|nr:amidophosphoribosyltransferase [Kiritimatiellia bacterium]